MKSNRNPKTVSLLEKFRKFGTHKNLFVISTLLFSIPVISEVIWDAAILKKLYIVDVYRLALFGFYVASVLFFFAVENYRNMFHEIMHVTEQQEEQLHIMKKLLEAKQSGSIVDLMEHLDKKKKEKDDEELKN